MISKHLLTTLANVPENGTTLLLLRHSIRDPIPPGEWGHELPITPEGRALAEELGEHLTSKLHSLHTSPILRCVQTAEAIRNGARMDIPIIEAHTLGAPGCHVDNTEKAEASIQAYGAKAVTNDLLDGKVVEGFNSIEHFVSIMAKFLWKSTKEKPGVHCFVTHDLLVALFAGGLLKRKFTTELWPDFLDGVAVWAENSRYHVSYKHWNKNDVYLQDKS